MTWRHLRGSASLWLAAVSVVVMLLLSLFPGAHDEWVVRAGFVPIRMDVAVEAPVALLPVWLTPLTASFLHADAWHLLFNMVMLLFCGRLVEEQVGKARLVILYAIGAYAAALAQYAWSPLSIVPMIGASGAISAIFGSFSLFYGKPKPVSGNRRTDRVIHAFSLLVVWVAIQWMVSVLDGGTDYTIATAAHVGGFLAGLVAFPLFKRKGRPR